MGDKVFTDLYHRDKQVDYYIKSRYLSWVRNPLLIMGGNIVRNLERTGINVVAIDIMSKPPEMPNE